MAKIKPYDEAMRRMFDGLDDEWDQLVQEHMTYNTDWTNYDEHTWSWYMEISIRKSEGWHHITISPAHKDVTVIYYLKSLGAKFKHSHDEFLIQDEKDAIMVALKYA